jgi:hypothetical protein
MRRLWKNADLAIALAVLFLLLIAKPPDETQFAGESGVSATAPTNPGSYNDGAPASTWAEKSYIGRLQYKPGMLASNARNKDRATGRMPIDPLWEPASALAIEEDLWGLGDGQTAANLNANTVTSVEPARLNPADSPFVGRLEARSGSPDLIVPVSFSDAQPDESARLNLAAPND